MGISHRMLLAGIMALVVAGFNGRLDACSVTLSIASGYVALNADDDNNNGIADNATSENPVAGENDLVSISLSKTGPNQGTITLSFDASKVKVWLDPTKTTVSPNSWDLTQVNLPTDPLYVEGIAVSTSVQDVELELTWTGSGGTPDPATVKATVVDVQLTECNSEWLPKGGDEDNTTTFTATIYPSNAGGIIRFTLPAADVSDYPGYCSNAGDEGDDEKDLQFPAQTGYPISGDYNSVATKGASANSATVTVKSFDYGASGAIMAEAEIGGTWFAANVVGTTTTKATVPKDTDGDGLADKWENDMRAAWQTQYGQAPDPNNLTFFDGASDKENTDPDGNGDIPAHATEGDGLLALEEYRGFKGIDPDNANAVVRLSPVRKELLVEVDVMKQIGGDVPSGGQATGLQEFENGTASALTDANKNWQISELVGFKLNPDTNQTRLYTITTNGATIVAVPGRLSEATAVSGMPNYSFSKHVPPTDAQVKTIMGYTQTAFNTAGVKLYYVIDDTPDNDPNNRVPWNYFANATAIQGWMDDSRDVGGANEQNYSKFVHLALVDLAIVNHGSLGASSLLWKGGIVCISNIREVVKNLAGVAGMSFEKYAGAIAAHELGHCVKCLEPTESDGIENAFTIRYTSTAQTATLTAPGSILYGYGKNARVECSLGQPPQGQNGFSLDWRQAANDTMQEIVNSINADNDGQGVYVANLCNPPNKPNRHPCNIVPTLNQDIKTNTVTVLAFIDDYIMHGYGGPGIISLQFNYTWTTSIKDRMDVKGHY